MIRYGWVEIPVHILIIFLKESKMNNRKGAEEFILKLLKDLDPSGLNFEKAQEYLAEMPDNVFHDWMTKIENDEATLVLFAPLFKSKAMTVENSLAVAEKYGYPMFERLEVTNDIYPDYTTAQEYCLMDLQGRRQSQNAVKKMSVPDDNRTIDYLTYQPTGDSKGSASSGSEINVLDSMGLHNCIEELTRDRGGDKGGWRAYQNMALRTGDISLQAISPYRTGVESTKVVDIYLSCMHLRLVNLWE